MLLSQCPPNLVQSSVRWKYKELSCTRWRRCFADALQTFARVFTDYLQPGEPTLLVVDVVFVLHLLSILFPHIMISPSFSSSSFLFFFSPADPLHSRALTFAGTTSNAVWSRENLTPHLNFPSIASSYHSFLTLRGECLSTMIMIITDRWSDQIP